MPFSPSDPRSWGYSNVAGTTAGGASIGNVRTKKGKLSSTLFHVAIEGGPELSAALRALEQKTQREIAKAAVLAAAGEIEQAWQSAVPVEDGNYRDAISSTAAIRTKKFTSEEGDIRIVTGASGSVGVRRLKGLPDEEQPYLYAGRLEFGSEAQTKRQLKSGVKHAGRARQSQPSARPAFDSSAQRAVDAATRVLKEALP